MGRLQKKKIKKVKKAGHEDFVSVQESDDLAGQKSRKKADGVIKKSFSSNKPVTKSLEKNIVQKCIQFLREVRIELKKVTWPSRKQTIGSTVVVIVLVVIISMFLGLVDLGLSRIIRLVL
jgi:preprotein translocase subunit SecE